MIWNCNSLLLAQARTPAPGEAFWTGPTIPLLLFMIVMFVVMTGSQRKRAKRQEEMLKVLKAGDRVTTSGGIIGVVVTVKERSVSIRSADTKLEVLKSAIADVTTEREAEASPATA